MTVQKTLECQYSKTSLIVYLTYRITSLIAYKIRPPTLFSLNVNRVRRG